MRLTQLSKGCSPSGGYSFSLGASNELYFIESVKNGHVTFNSGLFRAFSCEKGGVEVGGGVGSVV